MTFRRSELHWSFKIGAAAARNARERFARVMSWLHRIILEPQIKINIHITYHSQI